MINFTLESEKNIPKALRDISRSPRLPSGVPAGHDGAEAVARPQMSVGLGWVEVVDDPNDRFRFFDKRDDQHFAVAGRTK